ncbi:MAG: hypothetical protein ABI254_00675 [Chthoniobacterales bacterium]
MKAFLSVFFAILAAFVVICVGYIIFVAAPNSEAESIQKIRRLVDLEMSIARTKDEIIGNGKDSLRLIDKSGHAEALAQERERVQEIMALAKKMDSPGTDDTDKSPTPTPKPAPVEKL